MIEYLYLVQAIKWFEKFGSGSQVYLSAQIEVKISQFPPFQQCKAQIRPLSLFIEIVSSACRRKRSQGSIDFQVCGARPVPHRTGGLKCFQDPGGKGIDVPKPDYPGYLHSCNKDVGLPGIEMVLFHKGILSPGPQCYSCNLEELSDLFVRVSSKRVIELLPNGTSSIAVGVRMEMFNGL